MILRAAANREGHLALCEIPKSMVTICKVILAYMADPIACDPLLQMERIAGNSTEFGQCIKINEPVNGRHLNLFMDSKHSKKLFKIRKLHQRGISEAHNLPSDWTVFAIAREPINRFLSGWLNKCVQKIAENTTEGKQCYGCESDMACFIRRNYKECKSVTDHSLQSQPQHSYLQDHFMPWSWLCSSKNSGVEIKFLQYGNDDSFYAEFVKMLEHLGVNGTILRGVSQILRNSSTAGATKESAELKKSVKFLLSRHDLFELLLKTYYQDYQETDYFTMYPTAECWLKNNEELTHFASELDIAPYLDPKRKLIFTVIRTERLNAQPRILAICFIQRIFRLPMSLCAQGKVQAFMDNASFKKSFSGRISTQRTCATPGTPTFALPQWASATAFRRPSVDPDEAATQMWTDALTMSFTNRLKLSGMGKSLSVDMIGASGDGGVDMVDSHGLPMCAIHFDKVPKSSGEGPLEVKWIDLHVEQNAVAHHTERFDGVKRLKELPYLALRRGQEFFVTINFYRDFNPIQDEVKLIFEMGDLPTESKGTRTTLDIHTDRATSKALGWSVMTVEGHGPHKKNDQIQLQITTPPDAVIGSWHFKVLTLYRSEESEPQESVCPVYGIYLLFNPWCEADSVYMKDSKDRDEYVLNDVGAIWKGSHCNKQSVTWNYGQFEEGVLEACMLILNQSKLDIPLRSSPVHVVRMISQIINSKDGNGVMVSNWTNIFGNGTPPAIWTGSAPILREYATFGKSVRFGQCWVLAGLMNTVMRCLGIPSRVVTNYSSAHDMDNSSTVNIHFNRAKGKVDRSYNADTVWTFHCWNDCWMSRPDLPRGYGGWQAVDCTPQNKSDSLSRVGPAPIQALKEGNVGCSFDVGSIYTEINAEKSYWVMNDRKQASFLRTDSDQIGLQLLTKEPGTKEYLDISHEYKDRKLSARHRKLTMDALLRSNSDDIHERSVPKKEYSGDILMSLDLKESCSVIGEDFSVGIILVNRSEEERTVKLYHRINAALYTGAVGRCVHSDSESIKVPEQTTKIVRLRVSAREYLDKLLDQGCFVISVFGQCQETGQQMAITDSWCLSFPEITIKHEDLVVNRGSKVVFSFINPLPIFLTKCRFVGEGPGILLPKIIPCKDVAPKCWVTASFEMTPWEGGDKTLVARFISEQIQDIQGSLALKVQDSD